MATSVELKESQLTVFSSLCSFASLLPCLLCPSWVSLKVITQHLLPVSIPMVTSADSMKRKTTHTSTTSKVSLSLKEAPASKNAQRMLMIQFNAYLLKIIQIARSCRMEDMPPRISSPIAFLVIQMLSRRHSKVKLMSLCRIRLLAHSTET
jgi:hypothetical protein